MFTLKTASLLLVVAGLAHAEVHSLTLQQALEIAARQNPDVALPGWISREPNKESRLRRIPSIHTYMQEVVSPTPMATQIASREMLPACSR